MAAVVVIAWEPGGLAEEVGRHYVRRVLPALGEPVVVAASAPDYTEQLVAALGQAVGGRGRHVVAAYLREFHRDPWECLRRMVYLLKDGVHLHLVHEHVNTAVMRSVGKT